MLRKLDAGILEQVVGQWVQIWPGEQAYALGGKELRGSKRKAGTRALRALTLAGQALRGIVATRQVDKGNELAAALALLEEVPLEGKVVSANAGLLHATLAQKVVEKGDLHWAHQGQPASVERGAGQVVAVCEENARP